MCIYEEKKVWKVVHYTVIEVISSGWDYVEHLLPLLLVRIFVFNSEQV